MYHEYCSFIRSIWKLIAHVTCFPSMQTVQHNDYEQDPYAKEFGIRISEKLATVEARVLPAPWVRNYLH